MQLPGALINPNSKRRKNYPKKISYIFWKNYALKFSYILEWSLIQPTTTTLYSLWKISYTFPKKTLVHFLAPSPIHKKIYPRKISFLKKSLIFWDECLPSIKFLISCWTVGWMLINCRLKNTTHNVGWLLIYSA